MKKGPNEHYHDRVAARYDDIYARDTYWDYYFDVSYRHLRRWLPADLSQPVLDAGCGTGLYGLELLKSGFRVTFSDLSQAMLDRAQAKATTAFPSRPSTFVKADLQTLDGLPDDSFGLVTGQGDPLSFVEDPREAVRNIRRVLRPGGVAVMSVDSRFGGIDPFLTRHDLEGLDGFLRTGSSVWLADRAEERFPLHAFTPEELRTLGSRSGLEVEHLIGKTVFDLRHGHPWLDDRQLRRQLLEMEAKLGPTELGLGRAHHLQVVWRRPTSG